MERDVRRRIDSQQVGGSSGSNADRYGSGGGWEAHEGSASTSQDQAKEKVGVIVQNMKDFPDTIIQLKAIQNDKVKKIVDKITALPFQSKKGGAERTCGRIQSDIATLLHDNNTLTEEQSFLCQTWEKLHNNDKGDAWKAIENQGWTITSQEPYRFELTCDQEQQLSIADAQAFLRERIADNLTTKIQDGLIEHLADPETPEQDKGLLRKALAVVSDPANRGKDKYECGNVTVRLYQLEEVKTHCIRNINSRELYSTNDASYAEKVFNISGTALRSTNKGIISGVTNGNYDSGFSNQHLETHIPQLEK